MPTVNTLSLVDLVLLGMVMETPRSAYDIQKQIEFRHLAHWVRVSTPSVYKKVLRLESRGYLQSTLQKGEKAQRAVYTLTPQGRQHFAHLMQNVTAAPVAVLFDFNAAIANINKIPPTEALDTIHSIAHGIQAAKQFIEDMQPKRAGVPLVGHAILKQQQMVLTALAAWIGEFEADFRAESGLGTDDEKP